MLLLAFDTATAAVSVAVLDGGQTCAERTGAGENRHGELLAPLIAEALGEAGHRIADLDGVAVGVGPGPFTGLRVGLATARVLADALGIPLHGICSLDALADGAPDVVGMTDARRKEVYWARYAAGRRIAGPAVERPEVLAERFVAAATAPILCGPGYDRYAEMFAGLRGHPSRQVEATAIGRRAAAGTDVLPAVPLYLRRPDAVANAVRRAVS